MGQQEIKKTKSNQLQTIQTIPLPLKTFGSIIKTAKCQKISDKEFIINKGKENQFIIKTNKPAAQIYQYEGFVQIYSQDNKRIFAGKVNKMIRQDFGVQFDEKQNVFFRGEFVNDLYHGQGQTLKYQGEFKDGKKDGFGKWSDLANNIDYEGLFKDDKFDGYGYLNIETGKIYQFVNDVKLIGLSEKVSQRYAGEWANGKMNGSGKLSTKFQVYKGNFIEGLYDGQGIITKDGIAKKGKFSKGIFVKAI